VPFIYYFAEGRLRETFGHRELAFPEVIERSVMSRDAVKVSLDCRIVHRDQVGTIPRQPDLS
jgi:hypothetical protein